MTGPVGARFKESDCTFEMKMDVIKGHKEGWNSILHWKCCGP